MQPFLLTLPALRRWPVPRLSGHWPLIGGALSILLLSGCEKPASEISPVPESTYRQLLEMGFAKAAIVEQKDHYIVEGDMLFTKGVDYARRAVQASTLPAGSLRPTAAPGPGARVNQYRSASIISYANQAAIAVKIDPSVPLVVAQMIEHLVAKWNTDLPNCRLNFYISDAQAADITFRNVGGPVSPNTFPFTRVDFPASGLPGATISLLGRFNQLTNAGGGAAFRQNAAIMHSLGHAVGLMHTNTREYDTHDAATNPGGAIYIEGTPPGEDTYGSIMVYGNYHSSFSPDDVRALQKMYPEYLSSERVFDSEYYWKTYPDLQAAIPDKNYQQLAQHWVDYGIAEGRIASSWFNLNYYRIRNTDLPQMSNQELVLHWLNFGLNEGRRGSRAFDASFYLRRYPDLGALYGTRGYQKALDHWINAGRYEGRIATDQPIF